jgi:hypothetical protein
MSFAEQLKAAHLERRRRLWGDEYRPVRLPPLPTISGVGTGKMWLGLDLSGGWEPNTRRAPDIIRAVLAVTHVSHNDFMSGRRARNVTQARQIAYYFMRHFTRLSLPQIGARVGGKDHSTVLHGIRRVARDAETFGPRVLAVAAALQLPSPKELQFN